MECIKIATWNILSPELCSKKQFPDVEEDAVNKNKRLKKTLKKLEEFMNNGINIILLQEVTRSWGIKFTKLFKSNDYTVIRDHYGFKYNGNMGIMIAYSNKFEFEDMISEVISHKLFIPMPEYNSNITYLRFKTNDWLKWLNKKYINSMNYIGLSNLSNIGKDWFDSLEIKSDEKDAISRQNVFTAVKLKINNYSFYVANYHMPCAFKRPKVMMWHAEKCLSLLSKVNCDIIFGGDFNSLPNSDVYNLFYKEGFKSVKDNSETDTVNTFTSWNGEFKGCIDYIFYNLKNDSKINFLTTDEPENVKNYLPNLIQTSDHIPIISNFTLS